MWRTILLLVFFAFYGCCRDLQCDGSYKYFRGTDECYKIFAVKKKQYLKQAVNIDTADSYCMREGGDVVDVHSDVENQFVHDLIKHSTSLPEANGYQVLIGIKGGKWLKEEKALLYTDWEKEPGEGDCAAIRLNADGIKVTSMGKWSKISCNESAPAFICKMPAKELPETRATCPDGFTYHERNANCYMVDNMAPGDSGYESALSKCRQLGGGLLAIHTEEENKFIVNELAAQKPEITRIYIALRKSPFDMDEYNWPDNTEYDFQNWAPSKSPISTSDCVAIDVKTGLWEELPCKQEGEASGINGVVCEAQPICTPEKAPTKPPTASSEHSAPSGPPGTGFVPPVGTGRTETSGERPGSTPPVGAEETGTPRGGTGRTPPTGGMEGTGTPVAGSGPPPPTGREKTGAPGNETGPTPATGAGEGTGTPVGGTGPTVKRGEEETGTPIGGTGLTPKGGEETGTPIGGTGPTPPTGGIEERRTPVTGSGPPPPIGGKKTGVPGNETGPTPPTSAGEGTSTPVGGTGPTVKRGEEKTGTPIGGTGLTPKRGEETGTPIGGTGPTPPTGGIEERRTPVTGSGPPPEGGEETGTPVGGTGPTPPEGGTEGMGTPIRGSGPPPPGRVTATPIVPKKRKLPCPCNMTYSLETERCYKFMQSEANITEAEIKCSYLEGQLASIHSKVENDYIAELTKKQLQTEAKTKYVFIGLRSKPNDVADRYWTDGTPLDYVNWMSGKPTNRNVQTDGCVAMSVEQGTWDDIPCHKTGDKPRPVGFVCQALPAQLVQRVVGR